MLGLLLLLSAISCIAFVFKLQLVIRNIRENAKRKRNQILADLGGDHIAHKKVVGFFHPYW